MLHVFISNLVFHFIFLKKIVKMFRINKYHKQFNNLLFLIFVSSEISNLDILYSVDMYYFYSILPGYLNLCILKYVQLLLELQLSS